MTVLAVISATIGGTISQVALSWSRLDQSLDRKFELRLAHQALRRQLRQILAWRPDASRGPLPPVAFEGSASDLRFVATLPESAGGLPCRMMLLAQVNETGTKDLVLRWQRLDATPDEPWQEEVLLLAGIEELQISYRAPAEPGWCDAWSRAMRLPQALRVEVGLAAGEAEHWPRMELALVGGG